MERFRLQNDFISLFSIVREFNILMISWNYFKLFFLNQKIDTGTVHVLQILTRFFRFLYTQ